MFYRLPSMKKYLLSIPFSLQHKIVNQEHRSQFQYHGPSTKTYNILLRRVFLNMKKIVFKAVGSVSNDYDE